MLIIESRIIRHILNIMQAVLSGIQPEEFMSQIAGELNAKSWVEGGARISERHANIIINTGDATSLDVYQTNVQNV